MSQSNTDNSSSNADSADESIKAIQELANNVVPVTLPPNPTKLFIGQLPKTVNEDALEPLFKKFGEVIEIKVIREKGTGESKGCCFVNYANKNDADQCVATLHNKYTIPPVVNLLQVRHADSPGYKTDPHFHAHKLFVGQLPKDESDEVLRALFEPHGDIEEFKVLRDHDNNSKGCGFLKYTTREAALACISALDNKHRFENGLVMQVRFADSTRPHQAHHHHHHQHAQFPPQQQFHAQQALAPPPPPPQHHHQMAARHPHHHQAGYAYHQPAQYGNQMPQSYYQPPPQHAGYMSPYGQQQGYHQAGYMQQQQPQQAHYGGYNQPHAMNNAPGGNLNIPKQTTGPPGSNLFVMQFPKEWRDDELRQSFQTFGNILSTRVFIDKMTGESKCFGFVSFDNPQSAQAAIDSMNGYSIDGRALKVSLKNQGDRPGGASRDSGNNYRHSPY